MLIALQLVATPQGPVDNEPTRSFEDDAVTIGRAPVSTSVGSLSRKPECCVRVREFVKPVSVLDVEAAEGPARKLSRF